MRLYFSNHEEESCYDLDYWREYLLEHNISELKLFEAVPDHGNGFFFCREYGEIGESRDNSCGKQCDSYKPRNGKSGRCRFSVSTYSQGDKSRILKRQQ